MSVIKPQFGAQLNRGHPLARDLRLALLYNEGSGGVVYDASGNGHNATLTNYDPASDWQATAMGFGVDQNAEGEHQLLSRPITPPVGTDMTYVVWADIDTFATSNQNFWRSGSAPEPTGSNFVGTAESIQGSAKIWVRWGGTNLPYGTVLPTGLHCYAFVISDSNRYDAYVDGVHTGWGGTHSASYNGGTIELFGHGYDGDWTDGRYIAQSLWFRALDAQEIATLYAPDPWGMFRRSDLGWLYAAGAAPASSIAAIEQYYRRLRGA